MLTPHRVDSFLTRFTRCDRWHAPGCTDMRPARPPGSPLDPAGVLPPFDAAGLHPGSNPEPTCMCMASAGQLRSLQDASSWQDAPRVGNVMHGPFAETSGRRRLQVAHYCSRASMAKGGKRVAKLEMCLPCGETYVPVHRQISAPRQSVARWSSVAWEEAARWPCSLPRVNAPLCV